MTNPAKNKTSSGTRKPPYKDPLAGITVSFDRAFRKWANRRGVQWDYGFQAQNRRRTH